MEISHLPHFSLRVAGEPVLATLPHHPLQQVADVLRVLREQPGAVGELRLHHTSLLQGAVPGDQPGGGQQQQEEGLPHVVCHLVTGQAGHGLAVLHVFPLVSPVARPALY